MKLLFIHNQYGSHQIGGEDLVFQKEYEALLHELGSDSVYLYTVSNDTMARVTLLWKIWHSFNHAKKVKQFIKNEKIDVVHVHNWFPLLTPSILKAAKQAGAVVIQTLHNYRWWCVPATFYEEGKGPCTLCMKRAWLWPALRKKCYKKSRILTVMGALALSFYRLQNYFSSVDYYWVLSQTQLNTLKKIGVPMEKCVYKPNFVDTIAIKKVLPRERQGIIFVGRLEQAKGLDNLLEAWGSLKTQETLTIIGSGDIADLKRRFPNPSVRFLGRLSHDETLQKIAGARYLCQLSLLEETFGLTMIEALQLGVPVIGFDIGTRAEMIQHGANGWLATRETLASVIRQAQQYSPEAYEMMAHNAEKSGARFCQSAVMSQQVAHYRKILRDKR